MKPASAERRSFIVAAAVAAGLAGCGHHEQPTVATAPPRPYRLAHPFDAREAIGIAQTHDPLAFSNPGSSEQQPNPKGKAGPWRAPERNLSGVDVSKKQAD